MNRPSESSNRNVRNGNDADGEHGERPSGDIPADEGMRDVTNSEKESIHRMWNKDIRGGYSRDINKPSDLL